LFKNQIMTVNTHNQSINQSINQDRKRKKSKAKSNAILSKSA